MKTIEIENAIREIKDAQELCHIAHFAMALACLQECTLAAESESDFFGKGLHLRTKMDFDMKFAGKKGGEP